MKFGTVHCGNKECEKVIGHFPVDNQPKDLELYCDSCKEQIELDEDMQDIKDADNG